MITESKVTEIFCVADDFCKEFEVEMKKKLSRHPMERKRGTEREPCPMQRSSQF